MIRIQDLGELGYGGAVTLLNWWDSKRIEEGTLKDADVLKKAGFWTFLGIGGFATLCSAFGWIRRQMIWHEHVSHGFIYGFPQFIVDVVKSLRETAAGGGTGESNAVKQAKEVLRRRQLELAQTGGKALGQGQHDVVPGEVPITDYDEILA